MTGAELTTVEQRGTLIYMIGIEARTMTGWFARTPQGIIARRERGRNRWHLCSAEDALAFAPYPRTQQA